MLKPLWLQLKLFPLHDEPHRQEAFISGYSGVSDAERDRRSGPQWLRSVLAYLEFCTGDSWRRLSTQDERNNPERLWYLSGIRTIHAVRLGPVPSAFRPHLVPERSADDLAAARLAKIKRGDLVDELMRLDQSLTDRKILNHLSRLKLARMLMAARQSVCLRERTA